MVPHEAQAYANHGQSLERLAQRGGLSPAEALAVVEGRPWKAIFTNDAEEKLFQLVIQYGMKL
jgi:hypothetical protein